VSHFLFLRVVRFFRLPPTTIVGRFVLGERAPFAEALAGGVERGVKKPEDRSALRGVSIGVLARNPRFAFVKKDRGSHPTDAGFIFGAGSNILAISIFQQDYLYSPAWDLPSRIANVVSVLLHAFSNMFELQIAYL
jgi:hypothetical protein